MIGFEVKLSDSATPNVEAIAQAYKSGKHLKIMAASGANVVKAHFIKRDAVKHRASSRFHYYRQAASSTKGEVRSGQALVNIDHVGIGLRYHGGTVRPRTCSYLTIPVDPVSYGRSVREFAAFDIAWIINRRTGKGVVTLGGRVIYAVTKSSTHKADSTVLPTDQEIGSQVVDDLHAWNKLKGNLA